MLISPQWKIFNFFDVSQVKPTEDGESSSLFDVSKISYMKPGLGLIPQEQRTELCVLGVGESVRKQQRWSYSDPFAGLQGRAHLESTRHRHHYPNEASGWDCIADHHIGGSIE